MSEQSKKQYSREYKLEVLELLRTSGKPKAQLERDLGLYPGQIKAWQRALAQDGEQAFPGTGHQSETDEEMRRLRRENEILRQERDILKKAPAIGCSTTTCWVRTKAAYATTFRRARAHRTVCIQSLTPATITARQALLTSVVPTFAGLGHRRVRLISLCRQLRYPGRSGQRMTLLGSRMPL